MTRRIYCGISFLSLTHVARNKFFKLCNSGCFEVPHSWLLCMRSSLSLLNVLKWACSVNIFNHRIKIPVLNNHRNHFFAARSFFCIEMNQPHCIHYPLGNVITFYNPESFSSSAFFTARKIEYDCTVLSVTTQTAFSVYLCRG